MNEKDERGVWRGIYTEEEKIRAACSAKKTKQPWQEHPRKPGSKELDQYRSSRLPFPGGLIMNMEKMQIWIKYG